MITSDSTEAVLPSSAEQKQLVWSAYVRTLKALERTRSVLEAARSNLAEAIALFEAKRKAGAAEKELRTLQEQIETLKEVRRHADEEASMERRRADQLLVNLLAAEHVCDVLDDESARQKPRMQKRKGTIRQQVLAQNARWN